MIDVPLPASDLPATSPVDALHLVPLAYQQLRRIARHQRLRLGNDGTLATTALINEAYIHLAHIEQFGSHGQFLACAAKAMRHILIDRARMQLAAKRGAGVEPEPLEAADGLMIEDDVQVLAVHDALEKLALENPQLSAIVECRFFAGYSEPQTAEALDLPLRTVQRNWATGRAWLKRELSTS